MDKLRLAALPSIGETVEVKHAGEYRYGVATRVDRTRGVFFVRFEGNDWDCGPFTQRADA